MRLIDADKLMDYCQNLKERKIDCNDIARFPTAYDVDDVVKQLEEIFDDYVRYNPPLNDYEGGFEEGAEVMADKAIKIVKDGVKK